MKYTEMILSIPEQNRPEFIKFCVRSAFMLKRSGKTAVKKAEKAWTRLTFLIASNEVR